MIKDIREGSLDTLRLRTRVLTITDRHYSLLYEIGADRISGSQYAKK